MAKRRKKKGAFNLVGYVSIFAVVIAIAIVTWVEGQSLQEKIHAYDQREEELNGLIADEEERAESLVERKKYVQTKKFYEEVAQEKFGLIYKDEIILKPSEK